MTRPIPDSGALTPAARHFAERVILVHLQDPASTIASVGVLYGLCIAAVPALDGSAWQRIHAAAHIRFQPVDNNARLRQLDRIKKAGWKLYEAMSATPTEDDSDG